MSKCPDVTLIFQVYLPCALIVVLSWVGFWLNREATSDRVTLGVTAVLTLSAISMDSRSDLPKVRRCNSLSFQHLDKNSGSELQNKMGV